MSNSFNLLDDPWIPVTDRTGKSEELSITEVFNRAPELTAIGSDLPTQAVAIHRLLLAILQRCAPQNQDLPLYENWGRLWRAPALPLDDISAYLHRHRSRFDLIDPVTPFFQVADLRTKSGKRSGLTSLIADVPNNYQYFTNRAGPELRRLSFAEAARWLVHCQAYDPSGIKSGADGDDRVKGGKGYPMGTGWAGGLGAIIVEGETLKDTLLLNFVPHDADDEAFSLDVPVWERPPQTAAVESRPGGEPYGPIDLLTWQSRRIRLIHDGDAVTDVLISNGDPLTRQNRHPLEHMSAWRRSANQEKQLKQATVYMPATHQADRSFWHGLAAALPEGMHHSSARNAEPTRPSGVLTWLATVRETEQLPVDLPIRLRAIGMEYGTQDSVTTEVIDDVTLLHIDVLSNGLLRTAAISAVEAAKDAVKALAGLAGDLVAAAGGDAAPARAQAREEAFFELDSPYRVWLSALNTQTDLTAHRTQWELTVWHTVRAAAKVLLSEAGTPAWTGRKVGDRYLDSSLADIWFRNSLHKALPSASQQHTSSQPFAPQRERTGA